MTLGQNDFVQCCCSDIKILYGHMNFIVFTSSGSLVTNGPCSYYLARRDTTFDSMLYPILLLESLSKTTKYEDEGILDNFCRMYSTLSCAYWVGRHWCLHNVSSHLSLFMNTDHKSCPDPEKTARHETISRLCPSAFVQNEFHNEICQSIRCERRQRRRRDMDSCLAVLSWSG
jgi:hypothetical protein